MTTEEMRNGFLSLYDMMAGSDKVEYMHAFGKVQKEMMEWFILNKPDMAREWIDQLEGIRWKQYLTPKEADRIIASMRPKAPWSYEQWKNAMTQKGYPTEKAPDYNSCALWVTMNMVMSDSSETIGEYVDADKMFDFVYHLATDKLEDADGKFHIRSYFLG